MRQQINDSAAGETASPIGLQVHRGFIFIGLLICLHLIFPAFNAVHLEGFTAQTESIAMLMSQAPGIQHDPYLPVVSQFIYQTRSAVIHTLSLIYDIFPHAGDSAFRGMVLSSFLLLIATSVLFARRWGNMPTVFPMFALVLTQGIPETAFFFNDNIISAALTSAALLLVSKKSTPLAWIFCGTFIGMAILSRVDAVFVMPIIIGLILYSFSENLKRIHVAVTIFLTTGVVLGLSAIYHGFSIVDVFFLAGKFVITIDEKRWFAILLWVRVLFIGLSSLPLLVIGMLIRFRKFSSERSLIGILTFVYYPVLLAIFAPKATEIRYIFPLLAPIIALHVGTGMWWVYRQLTRSEKDKRYRYAAGVVVFSLAVSLVPPTQLIMSDGPRVVLGRFWTPILWKRWQDSVDESMRRAKRLEVALDNQQKNILVSTHFNDEFFMRLRLIEAGFIPFVTTVDYPGCNGFSLFKKGNSTVAHIRTDPQYRIAPVNINYNTALQIVSAFKCDRLKSFNNLYISTFGNNERGLPTEIYSFDHTAFAGPLTIEFSDLRSKFSPNNKYLIRDYGLFDFKVLTAEQSRTLLSNAQSYLSSHPWSSSENDPEAKNVVSIEDYAKYYRAVQGPTSNLLITIRNDLKNSLFNSDKQNPQVR